MDYHAELNALRDGKKDAFVVTPETFPAFQKALASYDYQNAIRGVAGHDGKVTYQRAEL